MAISRYRNTEALRSKFSYKLEKKTRRPIEVTFFDGQKFTDLSDVALDELTVFEVVYKKTDTLMALSQKYYGDPAYWWVIAFVNNVGSEVDLVEGQTISLFNPVELFISEVGL